MRSRMFQIVERAEQGDRVGRAYDMFVVIIALASIVPMLFHANSLPDQAQTVINFIDLATVYILAFDYMMRWMTHDLREGKPGDWKSFVRYPFTPLAIIDLLAILPTLNVLPAGFLFLRVLRVFRVFRYSRHLLVIANVFYQERRTLSFILLLACLYVFVTALLLFTLEGSTFSNFFDAVYWATITLTTVGFGDIYPLTDAGRLVTSISALLGVFVLALPAGVMTGGILRQLQLKHENKEKYFSQSFIGDVNWRYFLLTPERVRDYRRRNPRVRLYFAAILVGVVIDLLLYTVCVVGLSAPVWLDTTGTAIIACALDPAAGVIVGYVNNLVIAIHAGNAGNLLYLLQSVVVALAYGFLLPVDENGKRSFKNTALLLVIVVFGQAIIGFGLSLLLNGGALTTVSTQTYQALLLSWGLPVPAATFGALVVDRIFDSLSVFIIVGGVCTLMKGSGRNLKCWLTSRGLALTEDLSSYDSASHGEGDAAKSNAAEQMSFADADKTERAASMLEERAKASDDAGKAGQAQRYYAAASALRIMQDEEITSEDELEAAFDRLGTGKRFDPDGALGDEADD